VTYLKEGLQRQPFRVLRVAPGLNYRTALVTAQIHRDEWYADENAAGLGGSSGRRQPCAGLGWPRPLSGAVVDEYGEPQFEITQQTAAGADGSTEVRLSVGFVAPSQPVLTGLGIPLVSLAAAVNPTGGTLAGDQTLYYAVSALEEGGGESPLSFVVRATVPPGTNTNAVTLTGLSFCGNTARFNVYRGPSPLQLYRIASNQSVASQFTDTGLERELALPPDENYDHANFYWRLEQQPEYAATVYSASTIGNGTLNMPEDRYRGMVVRITRGKGAGQERAVEGNDATTLRVRRKWAETPDATSFFVVAEAGWHFAASARTSPVEFEVPNRDGATVHVLGRSANVRDGECAAELSPLTRWRINGEGAGGDTDVPPRPVFGLMPTGEGGVELAGIAFQELTNTRTISTATLTVHYWDELASPTQSALGAAAGENDTYIDLAAPGSAEAGSVIQVESELMVVVQALNGGMRYEVTRGAHTTTAAAHAAGTAVYHLKKKVIVAPFARDFFGSPASGSFSYTFYLPDARIASAELFMTNNQGDSEAKVNAYTYGADQGLRTLSGGQFALQVEGFLAIQTNAAPPLVVQDTHAVRDVFAVVREAPTGAPVELRLRQDETTYCTLTIPAGATVSDSVDGFGKPPLVAGAQINLDVVSVPEGTEESPGRDLTVTVRL
jgi:hypothetical protein